MVTLLLSLTLFATPKELHQWKSYLMQEKTTTKIPTLYSSKNTIFPQWYSPLTLKATSGGAQFSFEVTTYKDNQWVKLPGAKAWPIMVTNSQGKKLSVLSRNNQPALLLSKGTHKIKGSFAWSKLPTSLSLPYDLALLNLSINGTPVATPLRRGNKLIFTSNQPKESIKKQRNSLKLKIFRK